MPVYTDTSAYTRQTAPASAVPSETIPASAVPSETIPPSKTLSGSPPPSGTGRRRRRWLYGLFVALLALFAVGDTVTEAERVVPAGDRTIAVSVQKAANVEKQADAEEPEETEEIAETWSEKRAADIAERFQKVTPTVEELAAVLDPDSGADAPASGDGEPAAGMDSDTPAADTAPDGNAGTAPDAAMDTPSAADAPVTAESAEAVTAEPVTAEPVTAEPVETEAVAEPVTAESVGAEEREETWLVFQGRSIPITHLATWCSFQPGDFVWDGDRVRYTGTAYDAVFGIDVSAYHNKERPDGQLDWEAARKDGVSFAIIRAAYRGTTEGNLYEDPYFAQNVNGARAAGITAGAYIYSQAVSVEEALEEAEFVLSRLEGLDIDGPVCYDWEVQDRSSRAWNVSAETATACAAAFCNRIAEAGYAPLIYESKFVGYMKYDQALLEPYMRWYPQYPGRGSSNPCPDFLYHMDFWQFSDRCSVAGIGKRTDGSLWFRPKAE